MRSEILKKTAQKPEFWGQLLGTLIDVDAKKLFITYYVMTGVIYKIRVSRLRAWHFVFCMPASAERFNLKCACVFLIPRLNIVTYGKPGSTRGTISYDVSCLASNGFVKPLRAFRRRKSRFA